MSITFPDQLTAVGGNLVRSWDFISEAQSYGTESYGDNVGMLLDPFATNGVRPVIDTVVKPPGSTGSIKFTIPSQSSSGASGQWWMNFSSDLTVQFGAGDTFFVNYWQWFDSTFASYPYSPGNGWKQSILGAGDNPGCSPGNSSSPGPCRSSCTEAEVVWQNTYMKNIPQMYHRCPSTGSTVPFEEDFGGDFKLQNAVASPFCLYSTQPSLPGCVHYVANEWCQFQVGITLGPLVSNTYQNSHIRGWMAREGATEVLLHNWIMNLFCSTGDKYGKIWLLPYHSLKNSAEVHPVGYTRYGGLTVSRVFVPMSSASMAGTKRAVLRRA